MHSLSRYAILSRTLATLVAVLSVYACAGETPIEVSAYHEKLGYTAPVVLSPGERNIMLRFEPTGGIEVDLTGSDDQRANGLSDWDVAEITFESMVDDMRRWAMRSGSHAFR